MSKVDKGYKESFLKEIEKELTIKAACAKTGVARQSVYRWMSDDKTFAKDVKEAVKSCILSVNDDCEFHILKKNRSGDINAIKFWLKYHHTDYKQAYILAK